MLVGKRIAILAEDDFEDAELMEPLRAMKNASVRVLIVGSGSKKRYKGKRGSATITVDTTADKVKAEDFDAAICHGPQLLISADIVKGCRVTSWPSVAVDLKNAGATWVDEPVVRDGNIITSRKPADLPRFNKAIIEALI